MLESAPEQAAEDHRPDAPDPEASPPRRAPRGAAADRSGGVVVWAVIGLVWIAFISQVLVRWVTGDDGSFGAAPIQGPDVMDDAKLWLLRAIELVSVALTAWIAWIFLVRPWRRTRTVGLDGLIVVGAVVAATIDPLINYFHYTFAWNANAINLGSWGHLFPLFSGPTHYAEAFVWYVPQYVYLGIGLAAIECRLILSLRRRHPAISNVRAFSAAIAVTFLIDVAIEQLFLRADVYAFPRTIEALTLWPGSQYQFPIYESIFVACYATGFTALRMSAIDSPDGRSFVERGIHRVRPAAQLPVRLLAVTGYCVVLAAGSYFLPWSWLSNNVDSLNQNIPSYMQPGPERTP